MASAGHHKARSTKIAVVGGEETPEKVKINQLSPTKAAQREVDQILERAVYHERLAVQARQVAVELQLKIWL
jgi:hypothetical protein